MYINARVLSYRLKTVIPDRTFIKSKYKERFGTELNLQQPQSFNEKMQWLKINWRNQIAIIGADKYNVRNFVREKLGEDVLNELYAVYDNVEEIDLNALPDKFVLKVTNAYGGNVICADKSKVDWDEAFRKLKWYMKYNHYYKTREWAYKNIKPKIVCERFLDENGEPPKDYKFFCFNGEPKVIQVDSERFIDHKRSFYDIEWNLLDIELNHEKINEDVKKPNKLETMLKYASVLAEGIPFVRVDFYHVNNKIYFGEMTFYPDNGMGRFKPEEADRVLGSYLKLPQR